VIALHANSDPFPDAPDLPHHAPLDVSQRRIDRAQQKNTFQPHPLQWLVQDARLERSNVSGNVR
jgi:hypothetical protein